MTERCGESIRDHSQETLQRIRRIIGDAWLDCVCRDTLDEALQRFATQEALRQNGRLLCKARQARATIGALLDLLSDLDEVTNTEPDGTIFADFANLFDTIADEAALAAAALRRREGL